MALGFVVHVKLLLLDFKMRKSFCFRVCFQIIFLSISDFKFRHLEFPNQSFRMEGVTQTNVWQESFLTDFRMDLFCFWKPWEPFFCFLGIENKQSKLEIDRCLL